MNKVLDLLKGRKTYIVVIMMLVYVASGLYLGKGLDVELLLEALAIAGLRAGIK